LTLPKGAVSGGIKGGWLTDLMHREVLHTYPSEMAQNFWTAIFAFAACFVVTFVVSLFTKPREESELVGLVYSLTERPKDSARAWYSRPATLGIVVLAMAIALNIIFR
jgi:solute:Na+ symporter, SSS family